ncbi:MAG TPA: DUF2400 domain-containing protein [Thermoplasmata archaeon]|nr:DUF2400 domain-containing protein [Thermoplasmata archaeon]
MARAHRPTESFGEHLAALYAAFPFDRSLAADPVALVRPYADRPRAAEIAGLLAATIAVGNTTSIRRAFRDVEDRVAGDLAGWVDGADGGRPTDRLRSFRHRWIRGEQLDYLAGTLRRIYGSYDSLESVFLEGHSSAGFPAGLDRLAREFRAGPSGGAPAPRGYARLFPTPLARPASPCKRMTLYLRWMVRPGYPDLGLWRRVPTGELRIPLDQHVYWIAYHLGLTRRRSRSWATVEEVTESLRRIDPVDPIRFDFVLCHTGVSGDCPKRRTESICGRCLVRPDCLLWRPSARRTAS